jgi:hypothetical protein
MAEARRRGAWAVHACTEEMMTCKQAENEQLVKERRLN